MLGELLSFDCEPDALRLCHGEVVCRNVPLPPPSNIVTDVGSRQSSSAWSSIGEQGSRFLADLDTGVHPHGASTVFDFRCQRFESYRIFFMSESERKSVSSAHVASIACFACQRAVCFRILLFGSPGIETTTLIVETVALVACAAVYQSIAVLVHRVCMWSKCCQCVRVLRAQQSTLLFQARGCAVATLSRPSVRTTLRRWFLLCLMSTLKNDSKIWDMPKNTGQ